MTLCCCQPTLTDTVAGAKPITRLKRSLRRLQLDCMQGFTRICDLACLTLLQYPRRSQYAPRVLNVGALAGSANRLILTQCYPHRIRAATPSPDEADLFAMPHELLLKRLDVA